ncbi:hypothetical protein ACWCP6_26790 [Streptomyces sp. NPDC002004]
MAHSSPAAPQGGARVLAALDARLAAAPEDLGGALWRLSEDRRQLDANLIRLPPGASVDPHVEPDLDVVLVVVDGDGYLDGGAAREPLSPGSLAWLPQGSRRGLLAGPEGLAYLTVHRRRPGLRIGGRAVEQEGGEPACALPRVCPECGHLGGEPGARYCGWCGTEFAGAGY